MVVRPEAMSDPELAWKRMKFLKIIGDDDGDDDGGDELLMMNLKKK